MIISPRNTKLIGVARHRPVLGSGIAFGVKLTFSGSVSEAEKSSFSVSIAELKYDKNLAYSLTMDDGKESQFLNAYRYFSGSAAPADPYGGTIGKVFTDGCGNDVNFRAGIAIYTYSTDDLFNTTDLHEAPFDDFLSWQEIIEMYNGGWDVLNHEFGRPNGLNAYAARVEDHIDYVHAVTGALGTPITMSHFVIPGGFPNWISAQSDGLPYYTMGESAVFDAYTGSLPNPGNGNPRNKTVTNQAWKLDEIRFHDIHTGTPNINSASIDNTWLFQAPLRRFFRQSGGTSLATWKTYLDAKASAANSTDKYWLYDGCHGVTDPGSAGQVPWVDFYTFYDYMEANFGKAGNDTIWVASVQEVWEYLHVRHNAAIDVSWISDTEALITVDLSNCDHDLRRYDISLVLSTPPKPMSVSEVYGYSSSTNSQSLINLKS